MPVYTHDTETLNIAAAILDHTLEDGGGTFDTKGIEQGLTEGYVVGGIVDNLILPLKAQRSYLIHAIAKFLYRVPTIGDKKPYVGTWIDGDKIYLDLSELTMDKYKAISLANERNELAIYDAANNSCIEMV